MKNAKKIGIIIVQVVIAGIAIFVAIQHWHDNKQKDIDIGQVAVEEVEQTPVPSETATSDFETNAGGYGEETLTQTEDGSYLDGEVSDDEESSSDEETSEQTEATATPAPAATATPAPAATATPAPAATATPAPAATATPAPVQNDIPQQTVNQPDQSYDQTVDDLWVEDGSQDDQGFDWSGTVLE